MHRFIQQRSEDKWQWNTRKRVEKIQQHNYFNWNLTNVIVGRCKRGEVNLSETLVPWAKQKKSYCRVAKQHSELLWRFNVDQEVTPELFSACWDEGGIQRDYVELRQKQTKNTTTKQTNWLKNKPGNST